MGWGEKSRRTGVSGGGWWWRSRRKGKEKKKRRQRDHYDDYEFRLVCCLAAPVVRRAVPSLLLSHEKRLSGWVGERIESNEQKKRARSPPVIDLCFITASLFAVTFAVRRWRL